MYRRRAAASTRKILGDHAVVIDTEPQGSRLYEVAFVRIGYGYLDAVESLLVDPGDLVLPRRAKNADKTAKAQLVEGAGSFAENSAHIHNFLAGQNLVFGWNPANDRDNFLSELVLAGVPFGATHWIDVRTLFKAAKNPQLANTSLKDAYDTVFGGNWAQEHYALDDAVKTSHLLLYACHELEKCGVPAQEIETLKGRLGTAWTPVQSISPPKRRRELPLPPRFSQVLSPRRVEDNKRWLQEHSATPTEPYPYAGFSYFPGPARAAEDKLQRQQIRERAEARRIASGIRSVDLPLPHKYVDMVKNGQPDPSHIFGNPSKPGQLHREEPHTPPIEAEAT